MLLNLKTKKMKENKTICLDFDGVIHRYKNGYGDGSIYDKPNGGAIDGITELVDIGFEVVICSARPDLKEIGYWLKKYGLKRKVKITNKKPIAIAYIDDRAIRFTNWTDLMNYFR